MNEEYHTRIPELLRARGWTKSELARRMGITESGVTSIITGNSVPLQMLERASVALQVPLHELFADRITILRSMPSVRQDVLCPKCGRRVGLHIGIACEAMHPSRRFDEKEGIREKG